MKKPITDRFLFKSTRIDKVDAAIVEKFKHWRGAQKTNVTLGAKEKKQTLSARQHT